MAGGVKIKGKGCDKEQERGRERVLDLCSRQAITGQNTV